jgi:hypothetical protein
MAKFSGTVGFIDVVETSPGVHASDVVERPYKGDVLRNTQAWQESEHLNDDFTIQSRFSIVSDAYAYANYSTIRFIRWMGTPWKVTGIEIKRPRLILTVKGEYNE